MMKTTTSTKDKNRAIVMEYYRNRVSPSAVHRVDVEDVERFMRLMNAKPIACLRTNLPDSLIIEVYCTSHGEYIFHEFKGYYSDEGDEGRLFVMRIPNMLNYYLKQRFGKTFSESHREFEWVSTLENWMKLEVMKYEREQLQGEFDDMSDRKETVLMMYDEKVLEMQEMQQKLQKKGEELKALAEMCEEFAKVNEELMQAVGKMEEEEALKDRANEQHYDVLDLVDRHDFEVRDEGAFGEETVLEKQ